VTGGAAGCRHDPCGTRPELFRDLYHPGQPGYRYFDLVVAGYAGTGDVTAEIDTFSGLSAGSAHGGAGMW